MESMNGRLSCCLTYVDDVAAGTATEAPEPVGHSADRHQHGRVVVERAATHVAVSPGMQFNIGSVGVFSTRAKQAPDDPTQGHSLRGQQGLACVAQPTLALPGVLVPSRVVHRPDRPAGGVRAADRLVPVGGLGGRIGDQGPSVAEVFWPPVQRAVYDYTEQALVEPEPWAVLGDRPDPPRQGAKRRLGSLRCPNYPNRILSTKDPRQETICAVV